MRALASDWPSKYRPRSLKGIVGNPTAVNHLRRWAESWQGAKPPEKRGLILAGDPGIGKTTAAHALAHDFDWTLIELNASDARNAAAIEKVALRGALYDSFGPDGSFQQASRGFHKLIILDEADSLVERVEGGRKLTKDLSDRGGKPAIVRTLRQTNQPIILIVNDLYSLTKGSGGPLRSLTRIIRFQKLRVPTMVAILQRVCDTEGVKAETEALAELAQNAAGDLRAALNDLQGLAEAGEVTLDRVRWLGSRDRQKEMMELLEIVFETMDYQTPRKAAHDVEENPETIALWVDDNLPRAYTDPYDLQRAYDALSRADLYLGRVRRRQYYGFWSYASEMATSGVALAKKRPLNYHSRYRFPSWLMHMGRSRGRRAVRKNALSALARHCHTSTTNALTELRPLFATLLNLPLPEPATEPVTAVSNAAVSDTAISTDSPPVDNEGPAGAAMATATATSTPRPALTPSPSPIPTPTTATTPTPKAGFAPGPTIVAALKLEAPELAYIMDTKPESAEVKALLEAAKPLGWGPMEKLRGKAAREAMQGALEAPTKAKGKGKAKSKGKTKAVGSAKDPKGAKGAKGAKIKDDKTTKGSLTETVEDSPDPAEEDTPDGKAATAKQDKSQKTLFDF